VSKIIHIKQPPEKEPPKTAAEYAAAETAVKLALQEWAEKAAAGILEETRAMADEIQGYLVLDDREDEEAEGDVPFDEGRYDKSIEEAVRHGLKTPIVNGIDIGAKFNKQTLGNRVRKAVENAWAAPKQTRPNSKTRPIPCAAILHARLIAAVACCH
jgi:hypothetical protein